MFLLLVILRFRVAESIQPFEQPMFRMFRAPILWKRGEIQNPVEMFGVLHESHAGVNHKWGVALKIINFHEAFPSQKPTINGEKHP